jgi:1-acyl-sn-glycerol-3-phosphate acyltransferase
LEGAERMPDEPVLFAMNHTDRYNYWPFQYRLWRTRDQFTATWVKGKNYEGRFSTVFLQLTNNIPIASKGYLITRDFMNVTGRRPDDAEYAALRDLFGDTTRAAADGVPPEVVERPRDVLGMRFDPSSTTYGAHMQRLIAEMHRRFVALNQRAFDLGLHVLVFPEGTRSVRLSRGRPGLAQMALKLRRTIVPVGCNGSDLCYVRKAPFASPGRIVYRFGEPITSADLAAFDPGPFEPFDPETERRYSARFSALTDLVMDRLNETLDERHRFSEDRESDGVRGTDRFV